MFESIKNEILQEVREIVGEDFEGIFVDIANIEKMDYDYHIFLDATLTRTLPKSNKYKMNGGATKIVIIPNDADYVIKIPITGTYITERDADGNEIHALEGKVNMTEFDHLEHEQNVWRILNRESKKVFLPNITVGEINGIPIYVQERVAKTFMDTRSDQIEKTEGSVKSAQKLIEKSGYGSNDDVSILSEDFIAAIVEYYDEETARQVLGDAGDIGDLHDENYGFTEDGRPVIFDYADFFVEMYTYDED